MLEDGKCAGSLQQITTILVLVKLIRQPSLLDIQRGHVRTQKTGNVPELLGGGGVEAPVPVADQGSCSMSFH
jgi:hypothetical protein